MVVSEVASFVGKHVLLLGSDYALYIYSIAIQVWEWCGVYRRGGGGRKTRIFSGFMEAFWGVDSVLVTCQQMDQEY